MAVHMQMEKQILINKCLLGHVETMGHRGTLTNRLFLVPVYTLFHTIIMYGDGFLPEAGPLITF